jgi:hypothetical protein
MCEVNSAYISLKNPEVKRLLEGPRIYERTALKWIDVAEYKVQW